MKLALVTLHYKNLVDTLELLDSLSRATRPPDLTYHLFIVDNENDPELPKRLASFKFPHTVISNPENTGFAGGNNQGFQRALAESYEVIVAINNDVLVAHDFFKAILASPILDPTVGAVGGLIYFAKGYEFEKGYAKKDLGKVVWYAGGRFDYLNILGSHAHVNEVDLDQFKKPFETDFITGCLLIVRVEVLRRVGLFDEKYFLYLEDVDLNHRIKKAGLKLIVDPRIRIWHKVAQSSGIGSATNDYFISRNRLYFGFKWAPWRTRLALLRESLLRLFTGTKAQKIAFLDFLLGRMGKGSFLK